MSNDGGPAAAELLGPACLDGIFKRDALGTVLGKPMGFVASAIDTTSSVAITITGQFANTGGTITLESYMVELILP